MTEAEAYEFLSSFGGGSGNKAKRRIAEMEAAKQKPCAACDGWGTISTGIDEAPSTNCSKCDGTGKVAP
jgi:DnaJ-class molecular chaperone